MKNKFNIGDRVAHKKTKAVFTVGCIRIREHSVDYSPVSGHWMLEEVLELYKEKKKITLYRYTYRDGTNYIVQTGWSNLVEEKTSFKVIKTEIKEIEIEEE